MNKLEEMVADIKSALNLIEDKTGPVDKEKVLFELNRIRAELVKLSESICDM
jgi:hypothetical protein